jgi:ubiquinone/menaquinone biosynthesis C-methylase UbiE
VIRLLVVVVALCGACKKQEAASQGAGSVRTNADSAKEQAQFDSERKPEEVVKALGLEPGMRVADVGAGSGLLTVHLARAVKPNGKVVATDIEQEVLNIMEGRLRAAGLLDYVEPHVVEENKPGLGDKPIFDAILLAEVDHYFKDAAAWLVEASHALKPGGRIVISNRIYHRTKSMAAAKKANLVLLTESAPVATHFIAVFVVEEPK